MSFPRHQEIFPSYGGASPAANAPAHRLDEFPGWLFLGGLLSSIARLRFTSRAPVCCCDLHGSPIKLTEDLF
jgi:hypothetical protein